MRERALIRRHFMATDEGALMNLFILTGAGVSAESGLGVFRAVMG